MSGHELVPIPGLRTFHQFPDGEVVESLRVVTLMEVRTSRAVYLLDDRGEIRDRRPLA